MHSSQITGAIPHVLAFLFPFPLLSFLLLFSHYFCSFFPTFYKLDFTFYTTERGQEQLEIPNVDVESVCVF